MSRALVLVGERVVLMVVVVLIEWDKAESLRTLWEMI
jgi:hypothetical protein